MRDNIHKLTVDYFLTAFYGKQLRKERLYFCYFYLLYITDVHIFTNTSLLFHDRFLWKRPPKGENTESLSIAR